MGSVEFECGCGGCQFLTSTDNRSYVAHFIADQEYDAFSEIVDQAIEQPGSTPKEKADACMAWRHFQMPKIWQCPHCGSLYVEDKEGGRHRFTPASDDVPKKLFDRS